MRRRRSLSSTRSCCYCVGLLAVGVLLAALTMRMMLPPTPSASLLRDENHNDLENVDIDSVPPCTYQQLQYSFSAKHRHHKHHHKHHKKHGDTPQCWKLEDEIVRVPASAIANRDNLQRLGHGCKGGVFKAIVRLSCSSSSSSSSSSSDDNDDEHSSSSSSNSSQRQRHQYCSVALKTDFCHEFSSIVRHPFSRPDSCESANTEGGGIQSCLGSSTTSNSFMLNFHSFMGAEYTGALPFYAQQEEEKKKHKHYHHHDDEWDDFDDHDDHDQDDTSNVVSSGLLPTWAVVENQEQPLHHWLPSGLMHDMPHADKSLVGVILPLVPHFTSLRDWYNHRKQLQQQTQLAPLNSTELATVMLPAARGLAFLASMGLVFQDVKWKNIGVVVPNDDDNTPPQAFLYDNSLLAMVVDATAPDHQPPPSSSSFRGSKSHNATMTTTSPTTSTVCPFCHEAAFSVAKSPAAVALQADRTDFIRVLRDMTAACTGDAKLPKELTCLSMHATLQNCHDMNEVVQVLEQYSSSTR